MGVSVAENRTITSIQDVYTTSVTGFIGRKMGRDWFGQVFAGTGFLTPVKQTFELPVGAQYQAGGSLGLKRQAHTFLFTMARRFGDSYGIGAGSTIMASGAWNWADPRRPWSTNVSVSQQWFQGRAPGNLGGIQSLAGISRRLNSEFSLTMNYSWLRSTGSTQLFRRTSHAAMAALTWTPETEMR
jgi:hypothetical protein